MIKALLFGILKVLGGVTVLILFAVGLFFYKASGKGGYRKGLTGIKFYYKENGADQWTWDSKRLKGVDRSTFEVIQNSRYGKDKNRVYFKWLVLGKSDPGTFTINFLDQHLLSKDQHHVYYGAEVISKDAKHFQRIDKHYFKDQEHVYLLKNKPAPNIKNRQHIVIIEGANPLSFKLLPDMRNISVDDQHVFYHGKIVEGVRSKNLKQIGSYWTDGHSLFYQANKVEGADWKSITEINFPYFKDHHQVFRYHLPLKGANPRTLEFIDKSAGYTKDDDQIFFESAELPNVDLNTFEEIRYHFRKDKNQVYYQHKVLKDANPDTFQLLKTWRGDFTDFGKDDKAVYYKAKKLEGVNPKTFTKKGKDRYRNDKWTDGTHRFNHLGERI